MKYLFAFVLLVLFSMFLSSQSSFSEVKSRIVFNNGSKINGVVLPSKSNDSVSVKLDGGYIVAYPKSEIRAIESLRTTVSIGVGFGIPYGILGLNAEIEPAKFIDISVGLGTTILAGMAWNIGAIGYFLDQGSTFRPRISLFYGTNSMLGWTSFNSSVDNYESYAGLTMGAGVKYGISESGSVTLDLIYLLTTGYDDKINELKSLGYSIDNQDSGIKYSIGYKYSF
jgi:hypothetical protein